MTNHTVQVPLIPGESILRQDYGAVGRKTGGILFVTNKRVIFQPWDLGLAQKLIEWGCKALQVPNSEAILYVVGKLVALVDDTAQGVGGIVDAVAVGSASLFSLPAISLQKNDGTVAQFGVVVSPTTPNFSKKNNAVRDELLGLIRTTFL